MSRAPAAIPPLLQPRRNVFASGAKLLGESLAIRARPLLVQLSNFDQKPNVDMPNTHVRRIPQPTAGVEQR